MGEGGYRNGAFLSEEAQCGGPLGRAHYWGPWKICYERFRIQASLSIVALLCLRGTWNQKGGGVWYTGYNE